MAKDKDPKPETKQEPPKPPAEPQPDTAPPAMYQGHSRRP